MTRTLLRRGGPATMLLVAIVVASVTACSEGIVHPPEPPVTPPPVPGAVQGIVIDGFGAGVSGATVAISGPSSLTTVTGPAGQFSFVSIPAGGYRVEAIRAGFRLGTASVTVGAGQTAQVSLSLRPESLPFAAVLASREVSRSGATLVMEVDVAVVDADARPVSSLNQTSFQIQNFTPPNVGFSYAIVQQSVAVVTGTTLGPFSALMLMDQSGSIASTDPNNSRLQAAKIFFDALGPGDFVRLAAFAGSGSQLPFQPITLYGPGFISDGRSYFGTLNSLAGLIGGSTPLYRSTDQMIVHTANNAPTSNKAVVVFTDGDDTEGGTTINDIAARCASTGVRVFMVGLGSGIQTAVLGEIAHRCRGAVMRATDPRQLVAMYGTLGAMLSGAVSFYRTRWNVSVVGAGGVFHGIPTFTTAMTVNVPGGTAVSVPVYLSLGLPIGIRNDFAGAVSIDPGGPLAPGRSVTLNSIGPLRVAVWDCGHPGTTGCIWDSYVLSPNRTYRVIQHPGGPSNNLTIVAQ